jgi:hypothetical protein
VKNDTDEVVKIQVEGQDLGELAAKSEKVFPDIAAGAARKVRALNAAGVVRFSKDLDITENQEQSWTFTPADAVPADAEKKEEKK